LTASSIAWFAELCRLMFATDGPLWCAVTQSTPATTHEASPVLLQPRTRTGTSDTALATP
jgi:hypothetical protein